MWEDTINGQTITYKMWTIWINNVNKTINAEINIWETEIDFGNGENSTDVHINAKIQARKEFRLTWNTTVKLAWWVEGTLSFNKNNVRTVTIDNPVYNSITNPNVPRTITKKLPITPNNGEIFAFLWWEVIKVHQSGTTYTLWAVVEYTTVANLNKFDSQASIMNDWLKMWNARSKIYWWVEKKIRHWTVDASVLLTSDNLWNTLGINWQWKPNNKRFDIAVHTSVTQWNWFNWHVDSTTTWISAWLNYPNNTRFTWYLNHTNTEGVWGDTVIWVGVKHTF